MKLLLLVHGLPVGGTEVMVCHLARYLRGRGVEVDIGCLDLIGELGERLAEEGFSVTCFGRQPGFDLGVARRIAAHVRHGGHDVVHAHQYTPWFYGALARLFRRFPLVFTEHGRFFPDLPSPKRRLFNQLFRGSTEAITAVSDGVRRALVEVEGLPRDRIEVLYNGIDADRFASAAALPRAELRRRAGLPTDARVVGTIGRLDSIKNHGLLLRAFQRLAERDPNLHLAVLGDGPERGRLEDLATDLGITARTSFLGKRTDAETVLAGYDVFTLSSLSEGTPMTILEAMAARVPVVSTGVGGIPEIITHEVTGLLVDGVPPDCRETVPPGGETYVERFTEALHRALTDESLRRRLSAAAAEHVEREFSLPRICERYVQLYSEACGRRVEPAVAELKGP